MLGGPEIKFSNITVLSSSFCQVLALFACVCYACFFVYLETPIFLFKTSFVLPPPSKMADSNSSRHIDFILDQLRLEEPDRDAVGGGGYLV